MSELACEVGCKWLKGQEAVPSLAIISVVDGRTVALCPKCHNELAAARYDHPSFREFSRLAARREVILAALTSSSSGSAANLIEESVAVSERLDTLRKELFEFVGTWVRTAASR